MVLSLIFRAARTAAILAALVPACVPGSAPAADPARAAVPVDAQPITPVPAAPDADPRRVALGERLFADAQLSGDGQRTCNSCHDVHANGASVHARDAAADGGLLPFNTPSVFNAGLNFRLTWEGQFRDLEAHAAASLEDPRTMGTTLDAAVARIAAAPDLARQFREAYGRDPDRAALLDALAVYGRSLVTTDSRFDRWLRGDTAALSETERDGYRLFTTLGCVSCHQGVNIGGNMFQRQGVFRPLAAAEPRVVRVPSLRNVAVTAPYFYDGSAPTLAEAVRLMGTAQLGWTLSDVQVATIAAFLETLTGSYQGRPLAVPE